MNGRTDVVAVGYTALDYLAVVPHLPAEDTKLEIGRSTIQGGGPAATASVTARRLGLSVSFIGKTSDDAFGDLMRRELASEGIDISSMILEKGKKSQFAFILVDERTGARTILWDRGTISPLSPSDVDAETVRGARGLLVDSMEPAAGAAAAALAREKGIPVVIDAGTLREGVSEMLPLCDHIVASEKFSDQISGGKGPEEALERIGSFGPASSVVTLGKRGCVALIGGRPEFIKGFEIRAVDTTGAGDVFHGAFMYAVLRGWDTLRSCVFANAAAAIKCTRLGGRAGIPGIEAVNAFLSEKAPDISFD